MSTDHSLIALEERVDQIMPKLSPTQLNALQEVAAKRGHDLHSREIRGLEGWDLIHAPRIWGQQRPTSMWLTDLGHAVLERLEGKEAGDGADSAVRG